MITKDGRDVAISELTADNYVVPAGEEMTYHAVIEVVQFNPKTGARISKPRLQKFGRKAFEQSIRINLLRQGYTIKILHDPTEWIAAHKAAAEKSKRAIAAAEEARRNAEMEARIAAAVEKALNAQNNAVSSRSKASTKKSKKVAETAENAANSAE